MSWTFFCHNIQVTAADTCTWTPPTDPITAELIWSEEDGGIGTSGIWGTLGTDGAGRIIANPTGKKIIVSNDFGDTWTTYNNSLPDSNYDPGVDYLQPLSWQYYGGMWRVHLSEIDNVGGDITAYAAEFNAGTWSFGEWNDDRGSPPTYKQVGLRNGRYSKASMYWDANGVTVAGVWGADVTYPGTNLGAFNSYLAYARYTSDTGDNSVPATYLNADNASNNYRILRLSDGFFMYRHDGGRMAGDWVPYDLSTKEEYGRTNGSTAISSLAIGNGVDTVIMPRTIATGYRWYRGVGANLETFAPNLNAAAGGATRGGYCPQHWLYVAGNTNTLYTSYCEDPSADVFTEGPAVTLPDTISSTGADNNFQNVFYAGSGVWIGYYVRTVDRKVDIYRFTYGTLEGTCA